MGKEEMGGQGTVNWGFRPLMAIECLPCICESPNSTPSIKQNQKLPQTGGFLNTPGSTGLWPLLKGPSFISVSFSPVEGNLLYTRSSSFQCVYTSRNLRLCLILIHSNSMLILVTKFVQWDSSRYEQRFQMSFLLGMWFNALTADVGLWMWFIALQNKELLGD